MPNEVLNTKHPGTESIKAICDWSNAKFALKQDSSSTSFIFRLSFSPAFIGQTWVLVGGAERYTGTVKATPDDVRVIGIDDNSEAIRYTLTTQTIGGEEVTRIIQLNRKIGNYYPFGLYAKRILPIDIVPWSSGTDAQITAIINALDSDYLTIEDTNWQVGDTRTVTIGAMENTDGEGNTIVGETHAEQQITRVLGHIGSPSGISRVDGGNIHFIVLQGCALAEAGYMNSPNLNHWGKCQRRTWCNSIYYNAIPEIERALYKKMIITTGVSVTENINTEDWFALPAEKEYMNGINNPYSYNAEYNFLTQFSYYANVDHRKIKRGINGVANTTLSRSPNRSYTSFCGINKYGDQEMIYNTTATHGLNPFGCI